MFPAAHGVVSQGGETSGGGGEFTPTWASDPELLPNNFSAGGAGWAFTVSRDLIATKARVHPSSAASTTRGVRIWRQDDATDLGGIAPTWATSEEAWVEAPLDAPVLLQPGFVYVVTVWRPGSTNMRLRTCATNITPWPTIPEVTFIEGRETTEGNGALPTTPTTNVRAVDLWLEAP